MSRGITALTISDGTIAENHFLNAKKILQYLSDKVINEGLAHTWTVKLRDVIRLIQRDDTKALHKARGIWIEMEALFTLMLSSEKEKVRTKLTDEFTKI